ncbi:MAG: hypothetical protein J4431_01105 [Candidatus Aenigmarchaeota archaeon]|nr:hypothetical protein [Candidatus Aenigmarchaeota archaeon]
MALATASDGLHYCGRLAVPEGADYLVADARGATYAYPNNKTREAIFYRPLGSAKPLPGSVVVNGKTNVRNHAGNISITPASHDIASIEADLTYQY